MQALTLGYYRLCLVLKDKFIVATFLRTSLLKISVELCFTLPWINWISKSSLRVHHGMNMVLLSRLIFVAADPELKCLIVWWLYAARPGLTGASCSYLDSINQNLASWLLSIQIPDQSNGQTIIAKNYFYIELPVWYHLSHTHPSAVSTHHHTLHCVVTVAPNNRPHCHCCCWFCVNESEYALVLGARGTGDAGYWSPELCVLPRDGGMGDGLDTT